MTHARTNEIELDRFPIALAICRIVFRLLAKLPEAQSKADIYSERLRKYFADTYDLYTYNINITDTSIILFSMWGPTQDKWQNRIYTHRVSLLLSCDMVKSMNAVTPCLFVIRDKLRFEGL